MFIIKKVEGKNGNYYTLHYRKHGVTHLVAFFHREYEKYLLPIMKEAQEKELNGLPNARYVVSHKGTPLIVPAKGQHLILSPARWKDVNFPTVDIMKYRKGKVASKPVGKAYISPNRYLKLELGDVDIAFDVVTGQYVVSDATLQKDEEEIHQIISVFREKGILLSPVGKELNVGETYYDLAYTFKGQKDLKEYVATASIRRTSTVVGDKKEYAVEVSTATSWQTDTASLMLREHGIVSSNTLNEIQARLRKHLYALAPAESIVVKRMEEGIYKRSSNQDTLMLLPYGEDEDKLISLNGDLYEKRKALVKGKPVPVFLHVDKLPMSVVVKEFSKFPLSTATLLEKYPNLIFDGLIINKQFISFGDYDDSQYKNYFTTRVGEIPLYSKNGTQEETISLVYQYDDKEGLLLFLEEDFVVQGAGRWVKTYEEYRRAIQEIIRYTGADMEDKYLITEKAYREFIEKGREEFYNRKKHLKNIAYSLIQGKPVDISDLPSIFYKSFLYDLNPIYISRNNITAPVYSQVVANWEDLTLIEGKEYKSRLGTDVYQVGFILPSKPQVKGEAYYITIPAEKDENNTDYYILQKVFRDVVEEGKLIPIPYKLNEQEKAEAEQFVDGILIRGYLGSVKDIRVSTSQTSHR